MKASPEVMLAAKVMLGVFIALAAFSILWMIRSFFRPLEATPAKLSAFKKGMLLHYWILISSVLVALNALRSKQYYLLLASAILLSLALPGVIHYLRLKAAVKKASRS